MSLQDDLRNFTGTEQYHKYWLGSMIYTDGVAHFADAGGCHWFLDIIGTEVFELHKVNPFIGVTMTVANDKADIVASDGDTNQIWSRHIEYTDCPEGVYQFYLIDKVLLLTSEY